MIFRGTIRRARPGRMAAILSLALLTACETAARIEEPLGAAVRLVSAQLPRPQPPESEIARFVAGASPGQSATVRDPQRGQVRVRLEREYFSAAGVACRRFSLFPAAGQIGINGATGAACREADGWELDPVTSEGTIATTR